MDITRREATFALLDRWLAAYNAHDAAGCAACYAEDATLWDEAWNEKHVGRDAIREHYAREFRASPDITSTVRGVFESPEAIATEYVVRGTHDGNWRGLPATGNRCECTAWTRARISGDGKEILDARFTYDRARVFQQIGVLHDPDSLLGKTLTVLSHPVTMAQAVGKVISVRPPAPH